MNGAQGRIRTTDTRIFSPLLYQLSYLGFALAAHAEDRIKADAPRKANISTRKWLIENRFRRVDPVLLGAVIV